VHWPLAALMAAGSVLGGYGGAWIAQRIGEAMVRWSIIVIGLVGLGTDLVLASLGRQLFPWLKTSRRGWFSQGLVRPGRPVTRVWYPGRHDVVLVGPADPRGDHLGPGAQRGIGGPDQLSLQPRVHEEAERREDQGDARRRGHRDPDTERDALHEVSR